MNDLSALPSGLVLLPGQDAERRDRLPAADAFALSPFHGGPDQPLSGPVAVSMSADPVDLQHLERLRRLRRQPGFVLLADSLLWLKAVQLDLDYPPPWPVFVRQRLGAWLAGLAGTPLDPDQLHLHLTCAHDWVDEHGREQASLNLSLTQLAVMTGDLQQLAPLSRTTPVDNTPLAGLAHLSPATLLRQLLEQPWSDEYQQWLERFWQRHADTWRQLARVSLLDELARHFRRKTLRREGYQLILQALGYPTFPTDPQALMRTLAPQTAQAWLLHMDDEIVPGLLQVRSITTSHCFILRPGSGLPIIEYISDSAEYIGQRLLEALNDSPAHRRWLYHQHPLKVEARLSGDDPLQALQTASQAAADTFWLPGNETFMWRPVKRALALASAVELWQQRPAILRHLPTLLNTAAPLMRDWLHRTYGLDLDPRRVFVAWRPGHKRTPLGHVRQAGNRIHTPAIRPVNLALALVEHYQAEQPQGYIDEGGQWAIWHDPTGKGRWQADKVLPVSAEQLAEQIARIDFLALMTRRIETFWSSRQPEVEQALRAAMISQAVIALKQNRLQRGGFDAVVKALHAPDARWSVLGFQVQSSFIEGLEPQPCASLLLLTPDRGSLRVLYQAGLHNAFIEFADDTALNHYLGQAVANPHWRAAVMQYVPHRHRERLDYLFRLWAGQASAYPPASIVRPWSDILYQPDRHLSAQQSLYETVLPAGQPFAFMCSTLQANALEQARQTVVTPGQQALRYWSEQLRHLQWLMAPMSLLLTPVTVAALAAELGIVALDVLIARLPGHRYGEKQQALLSLLSFGLWQLAPATPRLLGALQKTSGPTQRLLRTPPPLRIPGWPRGGPSTPRQTRLVPFFHTGSLLKRWTLSGSSFGNLPVHAWKLGRRFLLWTSDRGQARTLVVSTHGYYLPWSRTVKVPNGTQIGTYAPHGHTLIDPGLHRVISQRVGPYALSTTAGNTPALPPLVATDKLLAGTTLPGRLKNYVISKYQGPGTESYLDIGHSVRNSHSGFFSGPLPPTPMDVLTVRNRFASLPPTLDDLFSSLAGQGIHYDRIWLLHCRCAALDALLDRAPAFIPPPLTHSPITP